MMQLSVMGCGWLGLPFVKQMLADGFSVKGSTTTAEKLPQLEKAGINPYLIDLGNTRSELSKFLEHSDVLIINIPPKLRDGFGDYVSKIAQLKSAAEASSVKKVLFIGSTSIYGETNAIVTEQTVANPTTESGRQLLEAEALLFASKHFITTSIRFGGLIGANRHPIKYLAGKTLSDPQAPINLIHQDDCVQIMRQIILQEVWGEKFNAAYPDHPTRADYYSKKAEEMGLEPPLIGESESNGKIISAEYLIKMLQYQFTAPV